MLICYYRLLDILHLSPISKDVKEFMIGIVRKTIEHRESNKIVRKDFMQCLIQLRNTGKINVDDNLWEAETAADNLKSMTIEECAAHVLLFYLAGFDTSSSAIAYCLHELTLNPKLMKQLQNDIDEALQRHNGVLTYECMQDIPLLENCVKGE